MARVDSPPENADVKGVWNSIKPMTESGISNYKLSVQWSLL